MLVLSVMVLAAQCGVRGECPPSPLHSDERQDATQRARMAFLPLPILFYTPETGVAGGGALLILHRADAADTVARPSSIMLDLIITQKKQLIVEGAPDIYLDGGRYRLLGLIQYIKYPQKFYGVGNRAPDDLEESFTSNTFLVSLETLRRIGGGLSGGVSLMYETRSLSEIKPRGLLEPATISGSRGGTTVGAGAVVHWDTRDNMFAPVTGSYYLLSTRVSTPWIGSDFDFSYLTLDLREYCRITESSVLAVQVLATLTAGDVPFFFLAQLGGKTIMRGYYEGRYRDKKLLAAQLEYRFPLFWRFRGSAFVGGGDVARTLGRFSLHTVKPSYGLGVRYIFDEAENLSLRFDFGFGRNTSGVYISVNEAF